MIIVLIFNFKYKKDKLALRRSASGHVLETLTLYFVAMSFTLNTYRKPGGQCSAGNPCSWVVFYTRSIILCYQNDEY
jgi:hypothetical protein